MVHRNGDGSFYYWNQYGRGRTRWKDEEYGRFLSMDRETRSSRHYSPARAYRSFYDHDTDDNDVDDVDDNDDGIISSVVESQLNPEQPCSDRAAAQTQANNLMHHYAELPVRQRGKRDRSQEEEDDDGRRVRRRGLGEWSGGEEGK